MLYITRKSMVTHYLFESSNYYWTPLLSNPNKRVYRNKQKIIQYSNSILEGK